MPTITHVLSDETGQQILAQLTAIRQALDDGALTNQQISTVLSDGTPTGAGFLDGGGLKAFFDGLKAKFTKENLVDGQAIAPSSVTATGAIQGSSISDGTGTLAQLRESVSPIGYLTAASNDDWCRLLAIQLLNDLEAGKSFVKQVGRSGNWQGLAVGAVSSTGLSIDYLVTPSGTSAWLVHYVSTSDSLTVTTLAKVS